MDKKLELQNLLVERGVPVFDAGVVAESIAQLDEAAPFEPRDVDTMIALGSYVCFVAKTNIDELVEMGIAAALRTAYTLGLRRGLG